MGLEKLSQLLVRELLPLPPMLLWELRAASGGCEEKGCSAVAEPWAEGVIGGGEEGIGDLQGVGE